MDPEGSLPHSQVSTTCPYPEPARSSPYHHIPLPEHPSYSTYQISWRRNSWHFMEPEGSLPHSQVSTTCPYHEPARSSPYPHIPLLEHPSYSTYQISWRRNSWHFMEPEGSLPHSQVSTTCPYPEPARSSPYPHIPLLEHPSYSTYQISWPFSLLCRTKLSFQARNKCSCFVTKSVFTVKSC